MTVVAFGVVCTGGGVAWVVAAGGGGEAVVVVVAVVGVYGWVYVGAYVCV